MLKRTGTAELPLHYGKAPRWLISRMKKLAREMVTIIVDEYGQDEFLRRISDPFWFQALGCVLGYDWHSSGVTTVLTGVLKTAIQPEEHGLAVCGGKGRVSRRAPEEIAEAGEKFSFSTSYIGNLRYASRISAKVDNTAIQAGYQLYHHAFFVAENGEWAVVQQGMCPKDRTARRYHWLSEHVENFVVEPHDAIVGETKRNTVLNMTAKESAECRKASADLTKHKPGRIRRMLNSIRPAYQRSLKEWVPEAKWKEYAADTLYLPRNINWEAVKRAYEFQPKNYEELLGIRGVGPATVRGLALISELIYGEKPSWRDPVKYSFAYGGKDGVPYPVNRPAMDKSIQILRDAIQNAEVNEKQRFRALKRLRRIILYQ
ncbi:MAG: DUF763 domain-containing protein [Thermoproteota archaeon]|nr:DUF763 domain-containing protein [Thermoproteota archaeon]